MPADDAARFAHGDDTPGIEVCDRRRWATPTGEPCPRSRRLDGGIEGTGDCLACGLCLLLGGLVD